MHLACMCYCRALTNQARAFIKMSDRLACGYRFLTAAGLISEQVIFVCVLGGLDVSDVAIAK